MSVYDYLQKQRMERAYELLLNEAASINQAAEAVGFTHACNFSTAFRHYFGYSPQTVRSGRS
jgi:AraC-like DNA-binding protein